MVTTTTQAGRPTRFRHARFYLTFRCNSRCGYCNVWQDPVFFGQRELTADGLRRALDQLRELGVEYVDFTGGEPALHRDLAAAVRHAHSLGMAVDVTTNAIRFDRSADEIVPYVATMNISLDTVSAEKYHAIRGSDTLDRTTDLVDRLGRDHPGANLKLIAVVTGETLPGLDDVVRFAQQRRVPIYLSPMFDYFEGQGALRDPARTARSLRLARIDATDLSGPESPAGLVGAAPGDGGGRAVLAAVRERVHSPYTVVGLDFLRHLERMDPDTPTDCGAGTRIVTVGPQGQLLLPCYHDWDGSLAWEKPYAELVRDPEYVRTTAEEVGLRPACRRCAVFPYLGLAVSYSLTTQFLVQTVSAELGKVKAWADRLDPDRPGDPDLTAATDRLLARLDRARLRPGLGPDERYWVDAVAGVGARTDLAAAPVAVEELLADHAGEDCWRVRRTPHRVVRMLYADVLPALADAGSPGARPVVLAAPAVQLALWQVLADLLGLPGAAETAARRRVRDWCAAAAGVLAGEAGRPGTARALGALVGIGILSGVPVAGLAGWGTLAEQPEHLLVAALARELPADRRTEVAPLLPTAPAPVRTPAPAAEPGVPDLLAAARQDPGALAALRAWCDRLALAGDGPGLRALLSRWNRAVDAALPPGEPRNRLQDALLALELAGPA